VAFSSQPSAKSFSKVIILVLTLTLEKGKGITKRSQDLSFQCDENSKARRQTGALVIRANTIAPDFAL
jgi:hypothetical protein